MLKQQPVYPIVPSYNKNGSINFNDLENYVKFLNKKGIYNIMTTAGTTQFNFMSLDEVIAVNKSIFSASSTKETLVLGLPPLGLRELEKAIKKMENLKKANLLLLYPDRHYSNGIEIVNYFREASKMWKNGKIWVHGMPMRKGEGGTYVYDDEMLYSLANEANVCGIKEESPTFNKSYDLITKFVEENYNMTHETTQINICVAGGDVRRFMLTQPVGATSFLVGAGSFVPEFDLEAYKAIKNSTHLQSYLKAHNELYDYFTELGWHRALRHAMFYKGFIKPYNRQPWTELSKTEKTGVEKSVKMIEEVINE